MGNAIGTILPYASSVDISLISIIAVILMLFSGRARSNGLRLSGGLTIGYRDWSAPLLLVLAQSRQVLDSERRFPVNSGVLVKLFFRPRLLLLLPSVSGGSRPKEVEEPHMPKWMESIDEFTAGRAFGLSALLAGVILKNLALTLAAALSIAQAGLSGAETRIALAVIVILARLTVGVPVLYYLFAGQ